MICRMFAAAVFLAMMVGCNDSFGTICTDEARPGLMVTVRDSLTSAALSEARVIGRMGTTADTAQWPLAGVYPLAYETPGIYQVAVEQAGYRTWTRANVRVTRDECHVQTVSLTALLQRQP